MNKKIDCFWYSSRQHRNRFCHDRNDLLILLDSSHEKKWQFPDHFLVWAGLIWIYLGTNLHCRIHLVHCHKDRRSYGLDVRTNMQTYDHWYIENLDACSYLLPSSQTPLKCVWTGSQILMESLPKHCLYWKSESFLHNSAARLTVHHSLPWEKFKNKNG